MMSNRDNHPIDSFEFDADAVVDAWEEADDEYSFDVEETNDEPSPEAIGKLLSALQESTASSPDQEPEEAVEHAERGSGVEPEFETLDSPGDEFAIQELLNDAEMRDAFLDDAMKCLAAMERSALGLETDRDNEELVRQYCRELHTLKGASASVGLSELAAYLHDLETSLEGLFESGEQAIELEPMFAAVDRVREQIGQITTVAEPESGNEQNVSVPEAPAFSDFSGNEDASIRIRASKLDRLMDMLAELVVLRNRRDSHVTEFNELNDELNRCATRLRYAEEQPSFVADSNQSRYAMGGSQTISEIAKDIAAVAQGLGELQSPVRNDNQSISRFIRDFRQELMQLRRVPVSGLFQRLQRAVRDAAQAEKKQVRLEVLAENSGLEQEIQEKLYEPLLHIVRNAVSHGIELPESRKKLGKPETGTITIKAHSNAQRLVIEIQDDGGGIDYAAVQQRAVSKGLIGESQSLSENELGKLIFHPGFSTRETASKVSGRGVGMDIVATTIEQLRGRIDVESCSGQGTTMRIAIPLRSGIEHVMVFRSAGQLFALPMQSVSAVNEGQSTEQQFQVGLRDVLSLGKGNSALHQEWIHLRSTQVEADDRQLAIAVDEIVGPEEVVVRGLPKPLRNHPLLGGVTLSGAGESVLLLEGQRLEEFCREYEQEFENQPIDEQRLKGAPDQLRALVVDDSMTARKLLVKKLQKKGIASIEASDGVEALERLRREQFDLIFTDLDMPRLGGMELLNDIQSHDYSQAPVIVVSSRSQEEFQNRVQELGAYGYLSKPLADNSFDQLMEDLQLKTH